MRIHQPRRVKQRLLLVYAAAIGATGGLLLWRFPHHAISIGAMAGVSFATAWAVEEWAVHRLRRRLHELREATDALGGGKLLPGLTCRSNDDFTKLTESVDRLAHQINDMVAEQTRLRQRLSRTEKLAMMGELAAIVAHEINNPLDGLQNSVEILRRQGGAESCEKLLALMNAGLGRIERTVRRLLSMSRDEPIAPAPVAAAAIVEDALQFVRPRLNRYGIHFVSEIEPAVTLLVDDEYMAQAMINLLLNAADAMKDSGGVLTVRTRRGPQPDRVALEIEDTGTGISEAHLPHIFEPFCSTKARDQGTGLGLAIVARIVDAHKGTLHVQSEPGRGTCFRLELPLAPARAAVRPMPQPLPTATPKAPVPL